MTPIERKRVYGRQKMYLDAGIAIFPVKDTNDYFAELLPSRRPEGLNSKENLGYYINQGIQYYRAIIPEGYMIIDLDEKHGHHGIASFNELLEELGMRTGDFADIAAGSYPYTVITGSGGRHLYFKLPPNARISSWIGFRDGIDLLCSGHGLVTAGSRKPTGNVYQANFESLSNVRELQAKLVNHIILKRLTKQMNSAIEAAKREEFYAEGCYEDEEEEITPEQILEWNYQKWDDGRKDYGGYNDFFMRCAAEAKYKYYDAEDVLDSILYSAAYSDWEDEDKEKQVYAMIRSMFGKDLKKQQFGGW